MDFRQIPLSKMDHNYKYAYRSKLKDTDLFKSVQKYGVLEPVWLLEGEKYLLLEGHQRVRAAAEAGRESIPALVYSENKLAELFVKGVQLNLSRGLSLPERFKILQVADEYFEAKISGSIQKILGLNRHPLLNVIQEYLSRIPEWFFEYLHQINIQFKNLKRLTKYSITEFEIWLKIFAELNFKAVEMIELLERIQDICLRDAKNSADIWQKISADEILKFGMTPQQKVHQLKDRLARLRSPLFYKLNDQIHAAAKPLGRTFGKELQINWDRTFEKTGLRLSLELPDAEAVKSLVTRFSDSTITECLLNSIAIIENMPEDGSNDKS